MFHNQGKNLPAKALETTSILFQTLSTNPGEMREKNTCKLKRSGPQSLDISDAETENDVLHTDKHQRICDRRSLDAEKAPTSHNHSTEDCSDFWLKFPESPSCYILFRGWAAQLSSLHSPFDKQIIRNDCKANFRSIAGVNTHWVLFHNLHLPLHLSLYLKHSSILMFTMVAIIPQER